MTMTLDKDTSVKVFWNPLKNVGGVAHRFYICKNDKGKLFGQKFWSHKISTKCVRARDDFCESLAEIYWEM